MGPANHSDKSLAVKRLVTDGSNWPLWKATLTNYFESRNLVKHVDGTADRPPDPPTFPKGHILSDDEEAKVDKAEERLEKFFVKRRPGQDPNHPLCIRITCSYASKAKDSQGHLGCTGH